MPSSSLFLAAMVSLVVATAYLYVGLRLPQRVVRVAEHRRALLLFSLWWVATGINILLGSVVYLFASADVVSFPIQFYYSLLQRVLLGASLVGLMCYLLYLTRGRALVVPVAFFYALYTAFLLYSVLFNDPYAVYVGEWRTDLVYRSASPVWMGLVSVVLLVIPPVAGSIAYFRLRFKLDPQRDKMQRWRALLVPWALIVWWVVAVVAGQREALGYEWYQIVNRAVGLAAALLILIAYHPPTSVRRAFGLPAADNEPDESPPAGA